MPAEFLSEEEEIALYEAEGEVEQEYNVEEEEVTEAEPEVAPVVKQEAEPDYRAQLEQIQRESEGRLRALQQERTQRQQYERFVTEKMPQLQEALKRQAPVVPDREEDPAGYLEAKIEAMSQKYSQAAEGVRAMLETQQAQYQRDSQQKQFWGAVQEYEKAFVSEHPDYAEALNNLRQSTIQYYKEAGVTDEEIPALIFQDEADLAYRALTTGKNPAEVAYKLAKGIATGAPQSGPAPQKDSKKIATIKRGVATSPKSLSKVAGNASDDFTVEDFANLKDTKLQSRIANDDDLWEELVTKGKISRSAL